MKDGAPTSMSVCVRDHVACVRIAGRANLTSSVDFKKLLQQLQDDGCTRVILDLGQCAMMDSTFLGVLARAARKCDDARKEGKRCGIELLHPSERVLEMLENLDVVNLFTIVHDAPEFDAFKRVEQGSTSRLELNRTCLEAHETLMNTNPDNERRFKDATEFLRKNLNDSENKE
jgi:anti-sigma B factor antagonist